MPLNELTRMEAAEAVDRLKAKDISPLDLIDAAEARIAEVEPAVNALPTLCFDRARDRAKRLMKEGAPADAGPGWLAGLPVAIKDLTEVAGVRTTFGSPIFADYVPKTSNVTVETLEGNGAIVIAKSNTPEFGAGANTFNEVFGKTLNPWNTALTCGGSSGGAAVALATGEVWLASGSDLGGSLRTPASFCSVVGLRPSPGRVARAPSATPFASLSVEGPMGRTVRDTALMLDAQCGQHPRDPISLPAPATSFRAAAEAPRAPARVAFSVDLGGIVPVAREVAVVCRAAAERFASLGATVEEASPDLHDAGDTFQVLRAAKFAAERQPLLDKHRDKMKPEVVWNIEKGLALDAGTIGAAELARGRMYQRIVDFFKTYDVLICPAALVAPFNVETRYIEEVEGHRFDNYVDWLLMSSAITLTSCPAISVPCGFTGDGRPIGLQLVGRPRGEAELLSYAAAFEAAAGLAELAPIDPRVGTA
jgi:amidase